MQIFLMDLRIFFREHWAMTLAALCFAGFIIARMAGTGSGIQYVLGGVGVVFFLIFAVKGSLRPVTDENGRQLTVKEVRDGVDSGDGD